MNRNLRQAALGRPALEKTMARFPDRKISETFLEFALPLIEAAGPEAGKGTIEQILKIAFTVWNSVVLDGVNGSCRHVDSIRQLTAADRPVAALVEQMISRKRFAFADDDRLVGGYKLFRDDGEWRLLVEARDPGTPGGR